MGSYTYGFKSLNMVIWVITTVTKLPLLFQIKNSPLIWVIAIATLIITPPITTQEPPSRAESSSVPGKPCGMRLGG